MAPAKRSPKMAAKAGRRLRFGIGPLHADEREDARADLADGTPGHPDPGLAHALNQGNHAVANAAANP